MPGTGLRLERSTRLTGLPRGRVFWYNTFFYIYKTIYAVRGLLLLGLQDIWPALVSCILP